MDRAIMAAALALCGVGAVVSAARDYRLEEREGIHHTFNNDKSLDVDIVNGTVEVIGDNARTIRVEGERIIRSSDKAEADRAKREATRQESDQIDCVA